MRRSIVFSVKSLNICCIRHLFFCRLVGRKPKSYNINIDASKVAYQTSQNDVKIYMETSNGIQKGRQYNQVRHLQYTRSGSDFHLLG